MQNQIQSTIGMLWLIITYGSNLNFGVPYIIIYYFLGDKEKKIYKYKNVYRICTCV